MIFDAKSYRSFVIADTSGARRRSSSHLVYLVAILWMVRPQ